MPSVSMLSHVLLRIGDQLPACEGSFPSVIAAAIMLTARLALWLVTEYGTQSGHSREESELQALTLCGSSLCPAQTS